MDSPESQPKGHQSTLNPKSRRTPRDVKKIKASCGRIEDLADLLGGSRTFFPVGAEGSEYEGFNNPDADLEFKNY